MSGPNSPDLSPLDYQVWGNNESYHKLQPMPKSVPDFKDVPQLIWPSLLEKAIDNTVKDYRKQLQTCVSANGGHFEHLM